MTILSAQSLHRNVGAREILRGASLSLAAGERAGLVGRNGCGKSTLARILAGDLEADRGELVHARGLRVMLLEQDPRYPPGTTAVQAVLSGRRDWSEAIANYEAVTSEIEKASADASLESLLARQARASQAVENTGGWELRHRAEAMLGHLAIDDPKRDVDTMSGGQRRRVALARLFVAEPDLAILDEPTNHLDLTAIEWLETHLLESYRGAVLLVTHDRHLLDSIVSRTFEIEDGTVHDYEGGWGRYLESKAERQAHAARAEANRQNFLRREVEWLRRRPKARTSKSKARVDAAHAAMAVAAPKQERQAQLRIDGARSGRTIVDIENLKVARDGRTLVSTLTLGMTEGQRLGIIGPNGCGKSSLIACLLGQLEPAAGQLRLGKNVKIAYLDQARSGLDPDDSVFDAVAEGRSRIELGGRELTVRQYLECMLFDVHAQRQKIGSLSGGERARVALAKTLRDATNLVILDEPTNDLDVDTLSALESALMDFRGTLIAVTHDRFFLDRLMDTILAFEGNGEVYLHSGHYSSYRESAQARRQVASEASRESAKHDTAPLPDASPTKRENASNKLSFTERHELDGLMPRIESAEAQLAELESALEDPAFFERPHAEQRDHHERLQSQREQVESLVERWEELEAKRGDE